MKTIEDLEDFIELHGITQRMFKAVTTGNIDRFSDKEINAVNSVLYACINNESIRQEVVNRWMK